MKQCLLRKIRYFITSSIEVWIFKIRLLRVLQGFSIVKLRNFRSFQGPKFNQNFISEFMVVRVWWVFRTRLYGGETPQTPLSVFDVGFAHVGGGPPKPPQIVWFLTFAVRFYQFSALCYFIHFINSLTLYSSQNETKVFCYIVKTG